MTERLLDSLLVSGVFIVYILTEGSVTVHVAYVLT